MDFQLQKDKITNPCTDENFELVTFKFTKDKINDLPRNLREFQNNIFTF